MGEEWRYSRGVDIQRGTSFSAQRGRGLGGGCLNMYDAPFGARAGRDDVAAVAVREAWEEREAWEVREA